MQKIDIQELIFCYIYFMKCIYILLIFLIPNLAIAQTVEKNGLFHDKKVFVESDDFGLEYPEELENSLFKIQDDSLMRLQILNDLGYYYHTRNLNKAHKIIYQGLEEASDLDNTYWQGRLQVSQGAILLRMEELEVAELILKNAIPKIPEAESWLLYTNLGYVFERLGDLGKAFDFAAKTLKIEETYSDPKAIAMAYSDRIDLFWKQGKFDVGLEYGLKSVAIFEQRGIKDLDYDFTLHLVGNNSVELGKLKEADKYFQQSIQIGEKYGFYNNLSDSYIALSELYVKKEEFENALISGKEALKYAWLLGNDFMIMRSYLALGRASNAAGDFNAASVFLGKSIQVATPEFGDKYYLSLVYLELSKALEGSQHFFLALEASRKYDQLRQDDVFTDQANEQIDLLQTQMELSQKESTIKLQEAKLSKSKILQAFILTPLGISVVFLFILYRIFLRKKRYSQLLEKDQHLHLIVSDNGIGMSDNPQS